MFDRRYRAQVTMVSTNVSGVRQKMALCNAVSFAKRAFIILLRHFRLASVSLAQSPPQAARISCCFGFVFVFVFVFFFFFFCSNENVLFLNNESPHARMCVCVCVCVVFLYIKKSVRQIEPMRILLRTSCARWFVEQSFNLSRSFSFVSISSMFIIITIVLAVIELI
jgi:hypothetical protein